VHPGGEAVAVADSKGKVTWLDYPRAGLPWPPLDAKGAQVAFSHDGKYLAVGPGARRDEDPRPREVSILNGNGELLHTLSAPSAEEVAFEPEGGCLVGAGWNNGKRSNIILKWDPATGKELEPVTIAELKGPCDTYVYSPAG